jgi:hypothetical protein|tara:strand:- start:250 stop:774 length:525 start_codon:yes stop_codon:yes gene_type:complete
MIQACNKITPFIMVSISFLAISLGQTRWHESNLKGLDQLSIEVIVDGLENAISPTWVESYVIEKLDQYKIWIKLDQPYPLLRVFIVGRPLKEVPGFYYTVEVSLFNYMLTMENYIENFNDNELTKDFSLAKIYEHQSIGYSVDRELKTHLESALFDHMDLFLDQWFQDNPRRRF